VHEEQEARREGRGDEILPASKADPGCQQHKNRGERKPDERQASGVRHAGNITEFKPLFQQEPAPRAGSSLTQPFGARWQARAALNSAFLNGLVRKPFIPAARQRSRSQGITLALWWKTGLLT